jgi:hypothetical protein
MLKIGYQEKDSRHEFFIMSESGTGMIRAISFGTNEWFRYKEGVYAIGAVARKNTPPADPEFEHTGREVGMVREPTSPIIIGFGKYLVFKEKDKIYFGSGKITSIEIGCEMPAIL